MKLIFSICISIFITYELIVHLVHKIYEKNPDEARHLVNQKIVNLLSEKPATDLTPNVNIFFSSSEWDDLGVVLSRHFYSISLNSFCDNNNGTISVFYNVAGILPKYQNNLDILKQCITIDTSNWVYGMVGFEIPLLIQSVSNTGLHIVFAYNNDGYRKIQQIFEIRKKLLTRAKPYHKPCTTFDFNTNANTSKLIMGIFYETWYQYGIKQPYVIDLKTHPHLLITGASGSGKSYALTFYLHQLLHKKKTHALWLTDFKGSKDFTFLSSIDGVHYATTDNVYHTILKYSEVFTNAKDRNIMPTRNQTLVIDEYPAFITSLLMEDKKKAEQIKSIIANILMQGRDVNSITFNLIVTAQRADASLLFNYGVRDNFHVWLALGQLSSEGKAMICDSPSELPKTIYHQGEGIIKVDGKPIEEILVPEIQNLGNKHLCTLPTPPPPQSRTQSARMP